MSYIDVQTALSLAALQLCIPFGNVVDETISIKHDEELPINIMYAFLYIFQITLESNEKNENN